ncbi:MAG: C-GCAxxG-C-C family protein [Candidatus Cloacimonetes bacterium]|jgi:C_GCAxxG_C_C family probable redox protein|nr:C-GCAxxG-C-C family protein [Candidatus Cloacimonadota bacterium]MDD2505812.1 C-GCAxxG-C-C family protein [Candidatus Cloacimonadota bacterium]MDD4147912.1 C-GCAxxG-C-C family protein [Candidatus Cloacimonadota bacterium]MDD4559441.1 C-GCAxxG-C-C family protein [Candidatus Cloacimonadota bacterium]
MQQSQWQQKAVQSFDTGYNCAQSVFVAFAPALGLDEKTALKIASTFGGGMHRGATCGALTGAMMALGLAAGFSEYSPEAKDEIGGLTRELVLRWQDQFGELDCRDILQIDPCDPEQKTSCPRSRNPGRALPKLCERSGSNSLRYLAGA